MTGVELGLLALAGLLLLIALKMPIGPALLGVSFVGLWALMGWRVGLGGSLGGESPISSRPTGFSARFPCSSCWGSSAFTHG